MHDDLIYEYATTDDIETASGLLGELLAFYMSVYDSEYYQFSIDNGIDVEGTHTEVREDYYNHVLSVLLNLRDRAEQKQQELVNDDNAEQVLYAFILSAYTTIENSEVSNALQLSQLQAVLNLKDQNSAVTIKKKWIAHPDCCEICSALDGTEIGIDEYFLVNGQVVELPDGKEFVYNYEDRGVCIAHPRDRCRIEFIIEY